MTVILTGAVFLASVLLGYKLTRRFRPITITDDYTMITHGSYTHAVPDDGEVHTLDPSAACMCGTFSASYPRDDGSTGWLIEHRQIGDRR